MGNTLKGTHGDVFLEAGQELGLAKETAQGILEEGIEFVTEAFSEANLYKVIDDLKDDADMVDAYLVEVAQLEQRFGFKYTDKPEVRNKKIRDALFETLKHSHPLIVGAYSELAKLENRLRSKRLAYGVEIYAAPPTLPLVQEIKAQKAVINQIEDDALAFVMTRLEEAEREANDSVSFFLDVFQPAWDDHNNPQGESDDS